MWYLRYVLPVAALLVGCASASAQTQSPTFLNTTTNTLTVTGAGTFSGPTTLGGATTLSGSTNIGGTLVGSTTGTGASVSATFADRPTDGGVTFNLKNDFGAACDGSTDDTVAIQAWLNKAAPGVTLVAPGGTCVFKSALTMPASGGVILKGAGAASTIMMYSGSSTTGNDFSIGPSSGSATDAFRLDGMDFEDATAKTSGYTLLIQNTISNGIGSLHNIWAGIKNNNSYQAVGLYNAGTINADQFWFRSVLHDALDVWNSTSSGSGAGQDFTNGFLINSGIGLHIGGNVGGLYTSLVSFGGNIQNVLIDTALAGGGTGDTNLQIEFGNFTLFDVARSGTSPGVELGQSGSAIQQLVIFNNDWFSIGGLGGNGCELQVDSAYAGYVTVRGTTFTNGTTGICNSSTSAKENVTGNYFQGSNLTNAVVNSASDPNLWVGPNTLGTGVGYSGLVNQPTGPIPGEPYTWASGVLIAQSTATSLPNSVQMKGFGGPTNANNWDEVFQYTTGSLIFRTVNDLYSASNPWLTVARTGYVPTSATFGEPLLPATDNTYALGTSGARWSNIDTYGLTVEGISSGGLLTSAGASPVTATAPGTGVLTAIAAASNGAGGFVVLNGSGKVPQGNLTARASSAKTVASPTAPASTSAFAMQGLAGTITPSTSGTVLITISGTVVAPTGTTVDNGITYQLSYGTGLAPANADALTGTQVGLAQTYTSAIAPTAAADVNAPFSTSYLVTGLSVGASYWVDLAAKSVTTASQMGLANVQLVVTEQ